MATVQATCSGCGRKFILATDAPARGCQICGSTLQLPAGFVPPPKPANVAATFTVGCPLCGRSKQIPSVKPGQSVACWFCQSPLRVGERDGVGSLDYPPEAPLPKTSSIGLPGESTPDAKLPWELLQRIHQAGKLGAGTADWVRQQLQKLSAWEQSSARPRSPFDARFTGAIVATSIFKAHHAIESPFPGGLLVSISLDESQESGSLLDKDAMLSTAIGLASLAVTGIGWIQRSSDEDDELDTQSHFLDIELTDTPKGCEIGYQFRSSTGARGSAEKLLGKDFNVRFPALLSRGARGVLTFQAAFGAAAPARLLGYLTKDTLRAHLASLVGAAAPADWCDRVFRLIKAE